MLVDNILLLRERYPALRTYFSEHEGDLTLEQFKTLESRAGSETIRYEPNNEKPLMVHSMYDPVREAERIIASHAEKITEKTHVFFYGVGFGYHVEKFIEMFPNQSYSLYEPIPEMFLEMSKNRELGNIINKNTQNVYVDRHNVEMFDYLDEFTTSNRNIHLIVLPSYKNIIKEKYEQFHQNIKDTIINRQTNLHTDASFQKLWVMNSLINFETVLNTPNMLKDIDRSQFEGKPALIVSAGPSLAEDIEHIRYIKNNNLAYIFSVGSAINSLIEYDVLPDAVFTYDPRVKNKIVFDKMISQNIDHIPMVFGSSVGYETIKNYQGPKVHFITSQDRTSLYFLKEQLNLEHDLILDSPSIAVMTFQILNKLGADPIVFAGQNLGYLHGRHYSKGIEYDIAQSAINEKKLEKALTTKDVYGNEIKTNQTFNNMRENLESFVPLYEGKTFINTTKGGAEIKGVPFQTIEEVINNQFIKPIQKLDWWKKDNSYDEKHIQPLKTTLLESRKEYEKIISKLTNSINSISIYTKTRRKLQLITELNNFDYDYNKLIKNQYYMNFLAFFIRVNANLLENELKMLNKETDVFVRGKEMEKVFTNFIEHCKQGTKELEEVLSAI
ncbi:motility associated factor glycosyltransferase family protein [Pseudogracilibacillus auburnensis]|uniref:motility associated factor glycosyltransferase family protein n=1 Tax=Pseudogracilibacillus auburnensis TaxID=1494959 RepID=UPI001A96BCB0|nr:6-hydroxymethylpterin diphosphokinase MptE-like protein [Pseudogracilibacillus auburnensis]MBO1005266.1 motility associated factor glycosyltransferase family protein [Pseudogracilibacillus auburnensis]